MGVHICHHIDGVTLVQKPFSIKDKIFVFFCLCLTPVLKLTGTHIHVPLYFPVLALREIFSPKL